MDFNYFYGRGADQFAFYQIPKILITGEKFAGITMESKILYSLMLDRASLSAKMDGLMKMAKCLFITNWIGLWQICTVLIRKQRRC